MRPNRPTFRPRLIPIALALAFLPGLAPADRCRPMTETSASSRDGRFAFRARVSPDNGSWSATLEDPAGRKLAEGVLDRLNFHAHFQAFVSDDGSRVVIFEPSAGSRDENRVLVLDGSLKLLKSFGLDDLLTDDELGRVTRSVSHIHFDGQGKPARLDGDVFAFAAPGGREVRVDLAGPKVLGRP